GSGAGTGTAFPQAPCFSSATKTWPWLPLSVYVPPAAQFPGVAQKTESVSEFPPASSLPIPGTFLALPQCPAGAVLVPAIAVPAIAVPAIAVPASSVQHATAEPSIRTKCRRTATVIKGRCLINPPVASAHQVKHGGGESPPRHGHCRPCLVSLEWR